MADAEATIDLDKVQIPRERIGALEVDVDGDLPRGLRGADVSRFLDEYDLFRPGREVPARRCYPTHRITDRQLLAGDGD